MAGLGEEIGEAVAVEAAEARWGPTWRWPPAVVATAAMRAAEHLWRGRDPFLEMKMRTTEEALALYEGVKPDVAGRRWRGWRRSSGFATAAKLAAAGNIIDFGVGTEFDLEATLAETLAAPLAIDESERF